MSFTRSFIGVNILFGLVALAGEAQAQLPKPGDPRGSVEVDPEVNDSKTNEDPIVSFGEDGTTDGTTFTIFERTQQDEFGNDWFRAGYAAEIGASAYRDNFTADTQFRATGNAFASMLGSETLDLVRVVGLARSVNNAKEQVADVSFSLFLLNREVQKKTFGGGAYKREKKLFDFTQPIGKEVTTTIVVAGVPLTVGASASANEFLSVKGSIWIDGIEASLTPGAAVTANLSGGLGVQFLSVGLKTSIKLMEVTVPLAGTLKFVFGASSGGQCYASLMAGLAANLYLTYLQGQISAYAKIGFTWQEKKLTDWPGYTVGTNISSYANSWTTVLGECGSVFPPIPTQS
jgi:hypothetical protein